MCNICVLNDRVNSNTHLFDWDLLKTEAAAGLDLGLSRDSDCRCLQDRHRGRRYWYEVLVFQNILVYTELSRASEIDSDVTANNSCYFSDSVIDGHRSVVDKLSGRQVLPYPCAAMKRRNSRKKFDPVRGLDWQF